MPLFQIVEAFRTWAWDCRYNKSPQDKLFSPLNNFVTKTNTDADTIKLFYVVVVFFSLGKVQLLVYRITRVYEIRQLSNSVNSWKFLAKPHLNYNWSTQSKTSNLRLFNIACRNNLLSDENKYAARITRLDTNKSERHQIMIHSKSLHLLFKFQIIFSWKFPFSRFDSHYLSKLTKNKSD